MNRAFHHRLFGLFSQWPDLINVKPGTSYEAPGVRGGDQERPPGDLAYAETDLIVAERTKVRYGALRPEPDRIVADERLRIRRGEQGELAEVSEPFPGQLSDGEGMGRCCLHGKLLRSRFVHPGTAI